MLEKKNFYINGKWIKPNSLEEIKVIDPATEDNCAVITLGNKIDVDMAVNAAKDAYESWAFSSKEERIGLLEKLYEENKILDHGLEVGKELAYVLSGGETDLSKELSEDDLFKLELDAFMKLVQTKNSQERIKHTLATGKPLVN